MPDCLAIAFLQPVGKKRHEGYAQSAGGNSVEEKVWNFKGGKVRISGNVRAVVEATVNDLGTHKAKDKTN